MKTLLIFLKAPYNGHKMREETMCNTWSCVFWLGSAESPNIDFCF